MGDSSRQDGYLSVPYQTGSSLTASFNRAHPTSTHSSISSWTRQIQQRELRMTSSYVARVNGSTSPSCCGQLTSRLPKSSGQRSSMSSPLAVNPQVCASRCSNHLLETRALTKQTQQVYPGLIDRYMNGQPSGDCTIVREGRTGGQAGENAFRVEIRYALAKNAYCR